MRNSAPEQRHKTAIESFKSANETIGPISKGMSLFAVTRGQFSMIDVILACLDKIGPAAVSVWTWTIADYEVQVFERMMMDARITSALLIIDKAALSKNEKVIDNWVLKFGDKSVKFVVNHAKIATIFNNEYQILARGSFNLNFNPRFENFDLSEGGEGFELVKKIECELPYLNKNASMTQIRESSRLNKAFTDEQLKLFDMQKIKVWQK